MNKTQEAIFNREYTEIYNTLFHMTGKTDSIVDTVLLRLGYSREDNYWIKRIKKVKMVVEISEIWLGRVIQIGICDTGNVRIFRKNIKIKEHFVLDGIEE